MRLIIFFLPYFALSKIKLILTPRYTQNLDSPKSYLDFALNTLYQINISIGSPPQDFSLQIDTSTSWLWVSNINCDLCHLSKQFDSSKSPTFQSEGKQKLITYDKEAVVGTISKDLVTVSSHQIKAQTFVLADQVRNFGNFPADGRLGLSFSDSDNYENIIKTMESSGAIKNPTFALFIGNEENEKYKSNIVFGGHELGKYSKDEKFTFIRALYLSTWSSILEKIQINGEVIRSLTRIAIFDSSVNVIFGPYTDILGIFTRIQEKNNCILSDFLECQCKSLKNFPKIDIFLDSKKFSMNPEEYLIRQDSTCTVLFVGKNIRIWYLGTPFLKSYYTYYDMDKKVIGLARSSAASNIKQPESIFWTVVVTILSATALLVLIILAIVYYLKRRESGFNPVRQQNSIQLIELNK